MSDPINPFSGGKPMPRMNHCPGASLRVTRGEYHEYSRQGIRWDKSPDDFKLPFDGGRGDARVRCHDEVMRVTTREDGEIVYGLCESCGVLENRHRLGLRAMATKMGGAR